MNEIKKEEKHICENLVDDEENIGICGDCKEHACGIKCTDCGEEYSESNCCGASLMGDGE